MAVRARELRLFALLFPLLAVCIGSASGAAASVPPPGSVVTPFSHLNVAAGRVARDQSGRLYVGGTALRAPGFSVIAVARYSKDGRLDPSFGHHGKVIVHLKKSGRLDDLAVAANGRILIASDIRTPRSAGLHSSDFAIVRLTAKGHLDRSFGRHGRVITNFGGNDYPARIIIGPNRRILVAGTSQLHDFSARFALARYLPDGRLDKSFGRDGRVTTDFGHSDQASDLVLHRSTIAVAGTQERNGQATTSPIAIAHYHLDGSPVRGFGHDGRKRLPFVPGPIPSGFSSITSYLQVVKFDSRGRIISAGEETFHRKHHIPTAKTGVNRFTFGGRPDRSFAGDGRVRLPYGFYLTPLSAIGGPHGSIFLGGRFHTAGDQNFAVWKIGSDGKADSSFGQDGRSLTHMGAGTDDQVNDLIGQSNGRIVAVGQSESAGVFRFGIARYLPNGDLDATFGQ